jgi:hypothetical protein
MKCKSTALHIAFHHHTKMLLQKPDRRIVSALMRRLIRSNNFKSVLALIPAPCGALMLSSLFGLYPFLRKLFADGGYQGLQFSVVQKKVLPQLATEIVKRSDQAKGFEVPRRWGSSVGLPGSVVVDGSRFTAGWGVDTYDHPGTL